MKAIIPADLRDTPFLRARRPPPCAVKTDLFAAIRRRDILLHHPYESFDTVVDFLEQAARDPRRAGHQTNALPHRAATRASSARLMEAANHGKQVTAVVELRARFDEANNIQWSRKLEEAGVHVVYGLVGYKIHCKICLVVRKDDDGIRRYVHLSTGQLQSHHRPPLHRPRPADLPAGLWRGRDQPVQSAHRHRPFSGRRAN